jgi:hypothetical protein
MAVMLSQFRPTLWSSKLIVDTDGAFVFANLANRDYQGEITGKGNIVKINEVGDITVSDYTENEDITISTLTGAQKELVIDQAKYFAFNVDDVLAAQSNADIMGAAMKKAAHAIADTVDAFIAAKYTEAGIATSGLGVPGTSVAFVAAGALSTTNILGMFSKMNRYANEANMPTLGRWFAIPPWLASYITYAQLVDNRTTTSGIKGGNTVGFGTGYVGSLAGWDLYSSNNVSTNGTTQWRCMFGSPDAISFAGQVTKMESGRVEKQFGDYVKGLYVYGAKVVRPDHLGVVYADDGGYST